MFGKRRREQREDLLFNGGLPDHHDGSTHALQAAPTNKPVMADVLPDPSSDPEAAVVSIEPRTGYVKAMVGGRDYFGSQPAAKCNLATYCNDAAPGRGTGSAFKPFTLAAALTAGIPLTEIIPAPGCIDLNPPTGPWHVCNADPGEGAPGGTNLIEGTVESFNTLYAVWSSRSGRTRPWRWRTSSGSRRSCSRSRRRRSARTTSSRSTWPTPMPPSPTAACTSPTRS